MGRGYVIRGGHAHTLEDFPSSPSGSARNRAQPSAAERSAVERNRALIREDSGSRAPEGGGEAPASSLDVVPGLPLDVYAQFDRRSDEDLEFYRKSTDMIRDIVIRKQHKGVFRASESYVYRLVSDGCLSTLQSLDRIGKLKMDAWSVEEFNTLLGRAAFAGNVQVCDWLNARARDVHGEPEEIFLSELGFRMSERTLYTNALQRYRNLGVMKWIHANGCPHDERTFKYAVWMAEVQVMRWLHADGCPMNYLATAYAAMDGKIDMLKWLRDRGCEWNASACALAAASGDLKTLKYLRDHGCPWNLATTLFAQRQACFADPKYRQRSPCRDVAAWAAQNGLPDHKWYSDTAPNKRELIAFGDVMTKAALDLMVDFVEGAGLFQFKECRWQDRDRDIDALIAYAMRPELSVEPPGVPPGVTRDGFGAAAFEAPPPPGANPFAAAETMDLAGEAAEQIKAAKAFVSGRAAGASDAAALASGVDTLALREGEAKRS
mmetsp:Transcript_5679/g.22973  ORF Transcript_5679/g.22973 Transcript_5679/m.22973 type:complete len:492 (-) Transcript_5679:55-1530(-)